ncbi:MAG: hypothetical protein WBV60_08690, partial [Terriglobales bacterium]
VSGLVAASAIAAEGDAASRVSTHVSLHPGEERNTNLCPRPAFSGFHSAKSTGGTEWNAPTCSTRD